MEKMHTDMQDLSAPLREIKKTFDELIIPHRTSLWRYCLHMTGSPWDAEDLVQETLLKSFTSLTQLWQPVHPKGFLFRIATNTWIDHCRKRKGKIESLDTTEEPSYIEKEYELEINEAMQHLVLHLAPRQRVVFLLAEVFQFKLQEISEMIGVTEGAVKSLLKRARVKLQQVQLEMATEDRKPEISKEHQIIIDAFIDCFNRRDPSGIADLLDDHACTDIVHVAQEYGKQVVRDHSLADWARDPVEMRAELHFLWGHPAIIQIAAQDDGEYVYNLSLLKFDENKITGMKDYYFCPELLAEAANELKLGAPVRKYTL
ncbi:sigma-70 family RNA polymerase sigma factor [Brevibacillus sp. 179-C9.3 HS]|uniref:sigma-70 family RNA polymerase sigma factor n=1 Tax=unclassified Brevibacillus TaxID=2684853 RepID=UPI0039A35E55